MKFNMRLATSLVVISLVLLATSRGQPEGQHSLSTEKDGGKRITQEQAVQIVSEKLGYKPKKGSHLEYDHADERGGRSYLVVHGYEFVRDSADGSGHTATWGWYYVDAETGASFEWDLANDKLSPIQTRRAR